MAKFDPNQVQAGFEKYFPELASSPYTKYPMTEVTAWKAPGDMIQGEKAFIASAKNQGPKQNYVYCTVGSAGKGYYHVLTKTSHVQLYNQSGNTPPVPCGCPIGKKAKKDYAEWNAARLTIYFRTRTARPHDHDAAENALLHTNQIHINPLHGAKL